MKLFTKIMLSIGLGLFGVGLMIATVAYGVLGFDPENLIPERDKMLEKTYTTPIAELDLVEIITKDRAIDVVLTDDSQLTIKYKVKKQNPKDPSFIEKTDETGQKIFRMEHGTEEKWYENASFGFFHFNLDFSVTVYLPRTYQNSLSLQTANGSIHIPELKVTGALTAESKNGHINIEKTEAGSIRLQTTNAYIHLDDCTAEREFVAQTTNASIETNRIAGEAVQLESKNGHISMDTITAAQVAATTTSAYIRLERAEISGEIALKTTSANITAQEVKAASLSLISKSGSILTQNAAVTGTCSLQTTNAKIEAISVTAADLDIQTTSAKIELDQAVAQNTLTATSKNGKIELFASGANHIRLKTTNAAIVGTLPGKEQEYNIIASTTNAKNNLTSRINETARKKLVVENENGKIDLAFAS